MKTDLLPIIFLGLLSLGGCSKGTQAPNIIIFLADDLGYGDLGCYGNPIIKTPHLDQLAREGVLMTDCHSGGTVCSPSRSALLTGRNPYRSGFFYIGRNGDTYFRMPQMSLRRDHYTLIGWLPKKADEIDLLSWMASNDPERFELYDLAQDPGQTTDMASQKPELVTSMKEEMTTSWREMRDEGLAGKKKSIN